MSVQVIVVRRDVFATQRVSAEDFRRRMTEQGVLVVQLMSSPGAGKTSLLVETLRHTDFRGKCGVLVGDIATERDAQRLAPHAPVVQLTTGGACHLESPLVLEGWARIAGPSIKYLFIENVGNLVCPASHDLGEHLRVTLLSTTEGDDKPGKYPKAFRTSHALVITKTDLLPHVPFSCDQAREDALAIQPALEVFGLNTLDPATCEPWRMFLQRQLEGLVAGNTFGPLR